MNACRPLTNPPNTKTMKHKNTMMTFALLIGMCNSTHAQDNETLTEMLPPCVAQSPGITVLTGDTLTKLSQRMAKPTGISDSEWIDIVYEKNRTLFINDNKDHLRVGATILFPCSETETVIKDPEDSTDQPSVAELVTIIKQTNQSVATQTEEIRQLVKTQTVQNNQPIKKKTETPIVQRDETNFFTTAMLGLTGLILLLLVALCAYLYQWRKSSPAGAQTNPNLQKIEQLLPAIITKIEKTENRILQRIINPEAGDENSDNDALQGYLKRLVQVDLATEDFMQDAGEESEALKVIKVLVEDALASCGVETFSPEIGADYRHTEGVADFPKTRVTDNPDDKFKIAEVLEKGYRIKTSDGYDIIYLSRVRIFTTN